MSARLYNKSLEIISSGKGWIVPLWQLVGWQGKTVWRLGARDQTRTLGRERPTQALRKTDGYISI